MIELRLQRVQALGVEVVCLQDFPKERLDAIQALVDRCGVTIGSVPITVIEREGREFRCGATATHGRGF